MAKNSKLYFRLSKLSSTVSTPYGEVDFSEYKLIDLSTSRLEEDASYNAGVKKGDRIRIIKGRKNPIGTEGTVKWAGPNRFGYSFNDALTGRLVHCNPSILLTLDDGSEVWTTGDNCINITNTGLKGIIEFNSEEEENAARKALNRDPEYNTDSGDVWYKSNCGSREEICRTGYSLWGLSTKSFSIYHHLGEKLYKETETEVMAVIDDFATDTYKFVRFSKKAEHNNMTAYVSTGTKRDMDDMWRGDTGLADAIKAYKEATAA